MANANISILTKKSLDLVIDLINAANSTKLDDTKIKITAPTTLTDDPNGHNTGAHVAAVKGSGYIGSVDITYNRLDIGLLFEKIAVNLDLGEDGSGNPIKPATTKDLLPALNARYGLGLDVSDITDAPVTTTGNAPWQATITIATGSLAYVGELDLTVGPDPEVGERLNTVILTTNLNGLMYPNSDTTKAQAREYSWGVDANSISQWLDARAVNDVIADNSLATELNKIVPEVWKYDADNLVDYNTAGAKVVYTGVNDAVDANGDPRDTNKKFNRIVQFQLDDTKCANMGGVLTLGYNVT